MSTPNIEAALNSEYIAGSFGLNTEYPNEPFTPVNDEPWARINFLPVEPVIGAIGDTGTDYHTGIMQLDIMYPQGNGANAAKQKAESIRTHFKIGKRITYSGQVVTIRSCHQTPRGVIDGWYTIVNRIIYKAFVAR